jgi:hypothetical protein
MAGALRLLQQRGPCYQIMDCEPETWEPAMPRHAPAWSLPVVTALVLASSVVPMKDEPRVMKPGDTIHVMDRNCGQGYARQVSVDENGERHRRCVKWSFFPPEIIGTPIR